MTRATHLGLHAILFIVSAVASASIQQHVGALGTDEGERTVTVRAHADLLRDTGHDAQADSGGETTTRLMRTDKQALAEEDPDDDDERKSHPGSAGKAAAGNGGKEEDRRRNLVSKVVYGAGYAVSKVVRNEPINCQLAKWGRWSECTVTCGTGDRQRARKIKVHAKYGGKNCNKLKDQRQMTATCETEACPTTTTVAHVVSTPAVEGAAPGKAAAAPQQAAAPAKKSNKMLFIVIGVVVGLALCGGGAFYMQNQKPKQQFDENGDPIEAETHVYDDGGEEEYNEEY